MGGCSNNPADNQLLEKIFNSMGNDFPEIVSDPEKYRIQILYSKIDRDINQKPKFTTFTFRTDSNKYFYPASTCLLYTSPSPRDLSTSRMPSSA